MSILLALTILQVGPNAAIPPASTVPVELDEQRARSRAAARGERASGIDLISQCQDQAVTNGAAAETDARNWLTVAQGEERALAQHCLGLALANQLRWAASALAFETALGLVPGTRKSYRAQLAALAGNTLLTAGEPARALAMLDAGAEDAAALGQTALLGQIETDRARALVAEGRMDEARAALEAAQTVAADNPLVWLLSATLARRQDHLTGAQAHIEKAAALDPADPSIGLEAGLIAALDGRDDSARRSLQSVIDLAPTSPEAEAAKDYLAQLGDDTP